MAMARTVAIVGAAGVALATASAAAGAPALAPSSSAHPASAHAAASKSTAHTPGHKARAHALAARRPVGIRKAKAGGSSVLALAGCYGRFIAWRDELAALMLQANSYTPWPEDKTRFDRVEQAFAASALRDRKLTLTLQPVFREADFPPDIRAAFQAGSKTGSAAFAANTYRHTQLMVIGQPDLSPRQRMAQLEANADEVFAAPAAACERLTGP